MLRLLRNVLWATSAVVTLCVAVAAVAYCQDATPIRGLVDVLRSRHDDQVALVGLPDVATQSGPHAAAMVSTLQRRISDVVEMFQGLDGSRQVSEWTKADRGLAKTLLEEKALQEFGFDLSSRTDSLAPALIRIRFVFEWDRDPAFDYDAWQTLDLLAELSAASSGSASPSFMSGWYVPTRPTGGTPYLRPLDPEAKELIASPLDGTGAISVRAHVVAVPKFLLQS